MPSEFGSGMERNNRHMPDQREEPRVRGMHFPNMDKMSVFQSRSVIKTEKFVLCNLIVHRGNL